VPRFSCRTRTEIRRKKHTADIYGADHARDVARTLRGGLQPRWSRVSRRAARRSNAVTLRHPPWACRVVSVERDLGPTDGGATAVADAVEQTCRVRIWIDRRHRNRLRVALLRFGLQWPPIPPITIPAARRRRRVHRDRAGQDYQPDPRGLHADANRRRAVPPRQCHAFRASLAGDWVLVHRLRNGVLVSFRFVRRRRYPSYRAVSTRVGHCTAARSLHRSLLRRRPDTPVELRTDRHRHLRTRRVLVRTRRFHPPQ